MGHIWFLLSSSALNILRYVALVEVYKENANSLISKWQTEEILVAFSDNWWILFFDVKTKLYRWQFPGAVVMQLVSQTGSEALHTQLHSVRASYSCMIC